MTQAFKIANYGINANYSDITANKITDGYACTGSSICSNTLTIGTCDSVNVEMEDLKKAVDKLTKTPEVRPDTTTKLDIKNGKISVKHYKDGFFKSERSIMPDIKDVIVYDNTVLVKFADNTQTVAVLDNEDAFNLEQGISICITKKLLGQDGSSVYNKLIKRAFKVKKQNEKAVEQAEKAKEEMRKRQEIARIRHEKKQLRKREKEIETYKEAIIRAAECLGVSGRKKFF